MQRDSNADADRARLADQLRQREAQLHNMTHDYLTLKHNAQQIQRRMKEDNEALLQQNRDLSSAMQRSQWRAQVEQKTIIESNAQQNEEVRVSLRKTLHFVAVLVVCLFVCLYKECVVDCCVWTGED